MKQGHAWRRQDVEEQERSILRVAKREPGWSCERIAKTVHCSHATVREVLRKVGQYPRPEAPPETK